MSVFLSDTLQDTGAGVKRRFGSENKSLQRSRLKTKSFRDGKVWNCFVLLL